MPQIKKPVKNVPTPPQLEGTAASWPAPPANKSIYLDNQRMLAMARTYAGTLFDHATGDFRQNPTTEHWQRLIRAMLVHQQVHSLGGKEEILCNALRNAPIGQWGHTIVKTVTGKHIHELASVLDLIDAENEG